jgi:hypothetical protein
LLLQLRIKNDEQELKEQLKNDHVKSEWMQLM